MIRAKKIIDPDKFNFVEKNFEAFVLAYKEKAADQHRRHKLRNEETHFSKFMKMIRLNFRYSQKTNDIDIWNKFVSKEHIERMLREDKITMIPYKKGYLMYPPAGQGKSFIANKLQTEKI